MNRDQLNELTKIDLMKLGEEHGMKLSPIQNKDAMIDTILGEPTLKPKIPDGPMPADRKLVTLDGEPLSGKKFKVTIMSTETNKDDVFIGINGYGIKVARNKEVTLHECQLEILKNAVVTTEAWDDVNEVMVPFTYSTIPFTATQV